MRGPVAYILPPEVIPWRGSSGTREVRQSSQGRPRHCPRDLPLDAALRDELPTLRGRRGRGGLFTQRSRHASAFPHGRRRLRSSFISVFALVGRPDFRTQPTPVRHLQPLATCPRPHLACSRPYQSSAGSFGSRGLDRLGLALVIGRNRSDPRRNHTVPSGRRPGGRGDGGTEPPGGPRPPGGAPVQQPELWGLLSL